MTHLYIDLYDSLTGRLPCCTFEDDEAGKQRYFYDLHWRDSAHLITRVVVRPGDEYRTGDHIRLLDRVRPSHSDTIAIDPDIAEDVDLNKILFNHEGFARRPEAVMIITNPNSDSSYRLRISLYDEMGQLLPSLIFYDWELPLARPLVNLEQFHFANQTTFIRIEPGPAYQPGDRVILSSRFGEKAATLSLEPGDYDLSRVPLLASGEEEPWSLTPLRSRWAETVAGFALDLQPLVHI